ncbi:MAG: thiamine pyrophosphate-dependent dehydrogenase E1 component subunit alpha [Candidatus Helarchaeota archaeon]
MINLSEKKLLEMYETLYKIRNFELRIYDVFGEGVIPGTLHTYIGEEAVATGVCANLTKNDFITSTHRGHGHCIAKGASLNYMMAELFAKKTGYCKAKGGSMHIADFDIGILGANGIVGGGLTIAPGAGLTCKLKYNNERVTACFFGDGASNQGTFHEGINLASAWKLPVIFVCENNLYAMGTRQNKVSNITDIADRAKGYGIPGVIVDGQNVLDVYEKTKAAVERAKRGEGPTLIECKTYRYKGHSKYDPATYRDPQELNKWIERDCIKIYKNKLVSNYNIQEQELNKIEKLVEEEIEQAIDFAKESPEPELIDALNDVYTKNINGK